MKHLPLIFFGVLFTLMSSFLGVVFASHLQFGILEQMTEEPDPEAGDPGRGDFKPLKGEPLFPRVPLGEASQGKLVYQELGCVACHTQQPRRRVLAPGAGDGGNDLLWADFYRGFGRRQAVGRDYIRQERVLLGTLRAGPDLMNVGQRLAERTDSWFFNHLYNPRSVTPESTMPSYRFLFEKQPVEDGLPSPDALYLKGDFAPGPGFEVVPTARARSLVAYLRSLRLDYDLPEMQREREAPAPTPAPAPAPAADKPAAP